MRKIKNPWIDNPECKCFGCCPSNPASMRMEFYEDGDDIVSFWKPQDYFQGWINTLHGGIESALLDEICGWVVFRKLQTSGMTSRLDVRFLNPIMTTEPQLTIRARLVDKKLNLAFIKAEIINHKGVVCMQANAVYATQSPEKAREMGFTKCELEDEQIMF